MHGLPHSPSPAIKSPMKMRAAFDISGTPSGCNGRDGKRVFTRVIKTLEQLKSPYQKIKLIREYIDDNAFDRKNKPYTYSVKYEDKELVAKVVDMTIVFKACIPAADMIRLHSPY
ncbi:unnamed protein product [Didymodactylos carnosus]|uniref:Uncharacterized protein n=1 Tax=Didymodactylos carnosus TaxID=1234261 RepID=A0A815NTT7_9BILA|nr:unnamed protein product [Didymodactylos carnosus]CAF1442819.1 unnamed protein product [Didymodactylos carnosus]CAF3784965.1 unnamed protein product [Didymodactylos carnosus]CAF4318357.1 unnamed protein product [Didymodactylos carnosus]